jgi:ABC-type multidrug transport system permease subunit
MVDYVNVYSLLAILLHLAFACYSFLVQGTLVCLFSIASAHFHKLMYGRIRYSASSYWLTALVIVFANVFYGSAMVFYNAYLPVLVTAHPT